MSTQFEIRAAVSDEIAELLDEYFFVVPVTIWGSKPNKNATSNLLVVMVESSRETIDRGTYT